MFSWQYIIEYLSHMERCGYSVKFEEIGELGNTFEVLDSEGNIQNIGHAGPKIIGEWIRIHKDAA